MPKMRSMKSITTSYYFSKAEVLILRTVEAEFKKSQRLTNVSTCPTGSCARRVNRSLPLLREVADLNAWADLGTKTSTSDPGIGTVLPAKRHAPIPYAGKERR
jgi:hypothetical protein